MKEPVQVMMAGRVSSSVIAVPLGVSVCTSANQGWQHAVGTRQQARDALEGVEVFQADYGPEDRGRLAYRATHPLSYAGCLGCPVCDSRHAP